MRAADALSLARMALTVPVALAVVTGASGVAFAWLLLALGTDFLDGWWARRTRSASAVGRVLDPLADKVLAAGTLAALLAAGRAPAELVVVVVLRDLALLAFGWLRVRAGEPVPAASPFGKVAFAALGAWIAAAVGGVQLPGWTAAAVAVLYSAAGFSYAAPAPAPFGGTAEGKR